MTNCPASTCRGRPPTGANLNLAVGYTFALVLQPVDGGTTVTVSAAPVGYDGGVRWTSWATNDLNIEPGTYAIDLTATEAATAKQRSYSPGDRPRIRIR